MKGDFSRRTFDADKHYSAVLVEQGRLLTDADSDEEQRIVAHRGESATHDIVGDAGGPITGAGFALTTPDGAELHLGPGRYYVAGTLLENESEVSFTDQPDRVDPPWPPAAGRHAVVLETWRRLVTALDDPSIREVALGGPTTSARERVVWQVGHVGVPADWVCTDALPAVEQTTGALAARAEPDALLSSPCLVPPQAGYTGLENQFYRVEVFRSGEAYDVAAALDTAVATGFPAGEPHQVTVDAIGPLAVGDAVEVFRSGLGADPVEATFGFVTAINGLTLTLSAALPVFGPTDAPMVRRVDAAFVVSRDNGCVVTTIEVIDGTEVTVHDLGPDDVLGFAVGQLVEVTDDRIELEGLARRLYQIADIDVTRRTVILRTDAEPLAAGPDGVDSELHPKLRRWDAAGAVRFLPDGSGWIHLENGNQVRFVDGHYRSGDYWNSPARAATVDADSGTIEWPQDAAGPVLLPPFGIERHRCVLGYVDIDNAGAITLIEDCRNLFPPLTSLRNLLFVGGDGQEGDPADAVGGFIPLSGRLATRVVNGGFPVEGATVRFTIGIGAGRLEGGAGPVDVLSDADGLATCGWALDDTEEHQLCVANLLDPSGSPISHQVVRFHASLDSDLAGEGHTGCCLSIGPGGDYPTLEAALEDQVKGGQRDVCLCLMPGDHEYVGETIDVEPERLVSLSIRGCGRGSRLHVRGEWRLTGFRALRLMEFELSFTEEGFLSIVDVADVEIRGMRISGVPPRVGLVRVYGSDRLHVVACVILALRAGVFDVPRRFFDGLDALTLPWEELEPDNLRDAILKTAIEVSALKVTARRALVKKLRPRLADVAEQDSRGEVKKFRGIVDQIERDGRLAPLLQHLELVVRAAAVARPGVALEIGTSEDEKLVESAARGSVILADNIIPGIVNFYGVGDPDARVTLDFLKLLDGLVSDSAPVVSLGGDVHVRDNRLGHLAVGDAMLRFLEDVAQNPREIVSFYESFHVTDNVVDGFVTEILAGHAALTSNDFTLDMLPTKAPLPDNLLAFVVADTATYTGNHARPGPGVVAPPMVLNATRASAEAANLELVIT